MAAFNQERFSLATDDTIAELRKIPTPAKVRRCVEYIHLIRWFII